MPAILAQPCVGATKPVKSRIVVVLPAPLGPRKATIWPLGMENVTSRTARNGPNCLLSPSASIMTGFDMLLRSSANSSDKNPARIQGPPIVFVRTGHDQGGTGRPPRDFPGAAQQGAQPS